MIHKSTVRQSDYIMTKHQGARYHIMSITILGAIHEQRVAEAIHEQRVAE